MPRRYVRRDKYVPGHPLAGRNGRAYVARLVLWDKTPKPHRLRCHWCGCRLTWQTVKADHVDGDTTNNAPPNIVAACNACNAYRTRGGGRRKYPPKRCELCKRSFKPHRTHHDRQRFCSRSCSQRAVWARRRAGRPDAIEDHPAYRAFADSPF